MKNRQVLPGMSPLPPKKDAKGTEYLSNIQEQKFVDKNRKYLENYINSDLGIAFSHIKTSYMNYVINGLWTREKFDTVLQAIIDKYWMLTNRSFMTLGKQYDEGKLKFPKETDDLSDEEIDEMLEGLF